MKLSPSDLPTSLSKQRPQVDPDALVFTALGGVGEIGMNLAVYGYRGKWIIVDCGITFADDSLPGIDILVPDTAFIEERRDDLIGLIATHAHEDHIGAIPYLWPRLRCPVYATAFTASVLRAKLGEAGLLKNVPLIEVPLSGQFEVGPFALQFVTMTHSIPEPNALVLRTPQGRVLHTGDWKFDSDPLVGRLTDFETLGQLGDEGIDVLIGDSTNATREGEAGSEADVREALFRLVAQCRQRVVIACFASNVARLQTAAMAALATGRIPALVGRSLWRMEQAARENGYLDGLPNFIDDKEATKLPPDKVLLICTGSQGEPRSALVRIANGSHQSIRLDKGDTVIFSSRVIPGNERPIGRMQNLLIRAGVEVLTEHDHFVHVSGHPARDELRRLYGLIKPKTAIPVHGEARHLTAHSELAASCGVPHSVLAENGDVIQLLPGPCAIVDHVETGRLVLDGKNLAAIDADTMRDRRRMTENGAAVATIVVDHRGKLLASPQVSLKGLAHDEEDLGLLSLNIERALGDIPALMRNDESTLREVVRGALRKSLNGTHGKKPLTDVHLVRI